MQCRGKTVKFRVLRPRHRRESKPIEWINSGLKKKLSSSSAMCLVDGEASLSNHNSEPLNNNPPAGMIPPPPPPESPSSPSPSPSPSSMRSSSRGDQETAQQGAPEALNQLVSTEDQNMNKQTNNTVSHGVVSVIGRRRSMEDGVSIVPAGSNIEDEVAHQLMSYDFFAVFDGRGAYRMAHICKERLHHIVAEQLLLAEGEGEGDPCWKSVMARSFARMDDELLREDDYGAISSAAADMREAVGASALVVLIGKEELVVANYGDSGVVLSLDGAALPLSRDRKEETTDTKQRIEATEGNVTGDENIEPHVLGTPEVTVHKRSASDNFLVIASDGLWDVVPNQLACDIVRKCCSGEVISRRILEDALGNCASASAAMLVELALARGSKDNISVIVVELQQVKVHNNSCSSPST